MRIQILTLVDITQTNARKGDDPYKQRQQQNFLTTIQTLSLRSNPTITSEPKLVTGTNKDFNFGSAYKGELTVWKLSLSYEQQVDNLLELLEEDFNLVPFITNLNETVDFEIPVFNTFDKKHKNLILVEKKIDE